MLQSIQFKHLCTGLLFILLACNNDTTHNQRNESGLEVTHEVVKVDLAKSTSIVRWTIKNNGIKTLPSSGWTIYFNQIAMILGNGETEQGLTFENVAGDYQRIVPSQSFQGLDPGDSTIVHLDINYPILRKTFLPSSLYIVYESGEKSIIGNVNYIPFSDEVRESLGAPGVNEVYKDNRLLTVEDESNIQPILPKPKSFSRNGSNLEFNGQLNIVYDQLFTKEAEQLKDYLSAVFTGSINLQEDSDDDQNLAIKLAKSADLNQDSQYTLDVTSTGITIRAYDQEGMFYGLQSLRHLVNNEHYLKPSGSLSIQSARIRDEPRFDYRGLMVDVSRNFHRKESIFKILDLMALFKLNKFHFHLTDDEGWRLEIEGLPELTDIGARRGHTTDESDMLYPFYSSGSDPNQSYGSGYYTKKDFIDILQYAKERHIEVIPEIDLPGHMRAAIKAMTARYHSLTASGNAEEAFEYLLEDFDDESVYSSAQGYTDNAMCVCRESAFNFIEKVIDELVLLYKQADAPLTTFHSGGDEVAYGAWQRSPVCQEFIEKTQGLNSTDDLHAYTLDRLKTILAKHKLTSAGWEEILLKHTKEGHHTTEVNPDFLGEDVQAYVWNAIWGGGREEMAYTLANMGFKIVICNSAQLYLDMAYSRDPDEIGLSWSGYTNTKSAYDLVPYDIYKTAGVADIDNFVKGKTPLNDESKANILGLQGQIWSEALRNEESLFYMMFPKLLSVAERAWSPTESWEATSAKEILKEQQVYWNSYSNTLGHYILPKLDAFEIPYRIPSPGAILDNGRLMANTSFPGQTIRFTLDGTEPTVESSEYDSPININGTSVKLKTFAQNGRSSRTAIVTDN